jgi:type II secretory pathway component PulC
MKALLLIIFSVALMASVPAWGESLVDVKVDELSKPLKPKWGKDPFMKFEDRNRPPGEAMAPKGLVVEGIISNESRALTIINGGFFRKGDIIEGFVIEDILSDRVMLRRGGRTYTLRIAGFAAAEPAKEAAQ